MYNGCYAHVISRSCNKNKLFCTAEDFQNFKKLLNEAKIKGQFLVFHYCLMHTHFHLAVCIQDVDKFSQAIKELKRTYTYWFNKKHKRVGPLWRDRYKSMLIENEAYLFACGQYIELNPVKAKMVQRGDCWEYSSSKYYEKGVKDSLVDNYDKPKKLDFISAENDTIFERGDGIGSKMFLLMLKE